MTDDRNYSPTDEVVKELSSIGNWCYNALHEINCLRAERDEAIRERDEARREVCHVFETDLFRDAGMFRTANSVALERGWDCFKENTNGTSTSRT